MLFKPLALATVATSFVIVPLTTSERDENIFKTLPVDNFAHPLASSIPGSAYSRSLSVPCVQCKNNNTELLLDLKIKDESRLVLNDFEIYPNADIFSGSPEAIVIKGQEEPKIKSLGYSLATYPKATAKDDGNELIEVDFRVIEIGKSPVKGIPTVKIDLVRTPGGGIMMASVGLGDPAEPECLTLMCQVGKMLDNLRTQSHKLKGCLMKKLKSLKNCPKKTHHKPTWEPTEPGMIGWEDISKGDIPEAVEPSMPSREKWQYLFRNTVRHIIMPILMGITAGVAVTFLALCIQTFARRLIRLARGKKDEDNEAIKESRFEDATVDEKAHLMP